MNWFGLGPPPSPRQPNAGAFPEAQPNLPDSPFLHFFIGPRAWNG